MSIPHYVNLTIAVLVMMLVALPLGAQLVGLFADRIDPASEASFDRLNLIIEQMNQNENPFIQETTEFYLHPDYVFAARTDGSEGIRPVAISPTNDAKGFNKESKFASPECGDLPCTCLFSKEGNALKCQTFEQGTQFYGAAGFPSAQSVLIGDPYYLGTTLDSVPSIFRKNLRLRVASTEYLEKRYGTLAFYLLGRGRSIYVEKTESLDTSSKNIYVSVIDEELGPHVAISQSQIQRRKNIFEKTFGGLSGNGPLPQLSNCPYISDRQDCSKLYNKDGTVFEGNSKDKDGYVVSSGKYQEAKDSTQNPYCCNWQNEESACTDGKIVQSNSCDGVYLFKDETFIKTITIPRSEIAEKSFSCCYANSARTYFENPNGKARALNPAQALCFDGKKNGDESDIDCGGKDCDKCEGGKICSTKTDCIAPLVCIKETDETPICGANLYDYCDEKIPCANSREGGSKGLRCTNNVCLAVNQKFDCTSPKYGCQEDQVCDTLVDKGQCISKNIQEARANDCSSVNNQCEGSAVCINSKCVEEDENICTSTCEVGKVCNAKNKCVSSFNSCETQTDCGANQVCCGGKCENNQGDPKLDETMHLYFKEISILNNPDDAAIKYNIGPIYASISSECKEDNSLQRITVGSATPNKKFQELPNGVLYLRDDEICIKGGKCLSELTTNCKVDEVQCRLLGDVCTKRLRYTEQDQFYLYVDQDNNLTAHLIRDSCPITVDSMKFKRTEPFYTEEDLDKLKVSNYDNQKN